MSSVSHSATARPDVRAGALFDYGGRRGPSVGRRSRAVGHHPCPRFPGGLGVRSRRAGPRERRGRTVLSRAHLTALLALLLSHASLADAQTPACDPRGMVPMTIPCEIATPSEPPHPHPLADGLFAVGISLATVGVLLL